MSKIHSVIAHKAKSGNLAAYYALENQFEKLDSLVNPGLSNQQVPALQDVIFNLINSLSFSDSERAMLLKRLDSIIGQMNLTPKEMKEKLTAAAIANGVPPELVKAMAYKESGFTQFTDKGTPFISDDGRIGIMQVFPDLTKTDYDWEKAAYSLDANIETGVKILLENGIPPVKHCRQLTHIHQKSQKIGILLC